MDPKEQTPSPDDSPISVGAEELERLLNQAESLVADISSGVGVADEQREPKELHATPFPDKPDALAALEETAAHVEKLKRQTGDDSHLVEVPDATVDEEKPSDSEKGNELVIKGEGKLTGGDAPSTKKPTLIKEESNERFPADRPLIELAATAEKKSVAPARQKARATIVLEPPDSPAAKVSDQPKTPEQAIGTTVDQPAPIVVRSVGWRRFPRLIFGMTKAIALAPVKATIAVLVLIDKPFAGLSATTKLALGLIGLISLIMGVAAIFLPKLLQSNPFEHVGPYAN
ncbi:MAG: hypothetical protein HS101_08820 [Planctomycetia bacterium]|jgi:hypothetical protein|nr:hypothetical protein [Planctomycetia bacterium]MCC7315931.1 hypothetical protein [Planctomycetota bacterium]OQZ07018.1 MAG: hypothetical protein B6D36_02045 [Planctomycetes bacterium UTPLA1]